MKIYNTTSNYMTTGINTGDWGFTFYYSDVHLTVGANNVTTYLQTNVEVVTQDFLGSAQSSVGIVGGNNEPLTVVSPEYAPYPFAGNCVIAYITTAQGGLSTAEKELEEDFEFLAIKNQAGTIQGFLVWGTFKVTKTEFYTPQLMGDTGQATYDVTQVASWNPVDGLEHSSLDYSEKISRIVES